MSCNNYCSRNYSSGSLRNSCHVPVNSSIALCSTNVGCGGAFFLPSTCQRSIWLLDNCQETYSDPTEETCGEPASCQPATCESSNCENSCCSSTAHYVPRPCQGTSFLPVSSYNPSSCFPVPYRPLNYGPSGCHPIRPLLYSCQPLGYAPSGYRPFNSLSSSCRPLSLLLLGHQPSGCLAGGPQSLSFVSNSLRPLWPLSRGCQPLTHVVSTCRPSCYAVGSY